MVNPSNLYAERIYAEHPTIMWALDDSADYVAMRPDADLVLDTAALNKYQLTTSDITNFSAYQTPPLLDSETTKITLTPGATTWTTRTAYLYSSTGVTIDSSTTSFAIAFYYYSANPYITSIKVGYRDANIGSVIDSQTFTISEYNSWQFISKTFNNVSTPSIQIYIEFAYSENPVLPLNTDTYEVLINGLSMGYASEEFSKNSIGVKQSVYSATDINTSIHGFSATTYAIPADAYGISSTGSNGYYCIMHSRLLAKNSGIPMVFGSSNSTIVYPHPTTETPSMVFPAKGFLNQIGKNNNYTFEFWLKARVTKNNSVYRIFGPVASKDGLYVNKNCLTLRVGNKFGSHYVGDWHRPMLIDIRYTPSQVSVLVNGENVISFSIDSSDTSLFPTKTNSGTGKSQDWVGFYANSSSSIQTLELDTIAIYPYVVESAQAKRRYVFGQGVEYSQNINVAYNGKSFFVDYPSANYANNYRYPGIKGWAAKTNDNFSISNGTLSTPSMSLPTVSYADGKTYSDFASSSLQTTTSYFRINTTNYNGYLSYESLETIPDSRTKAFVLSVFPTSYIANKSVTVFKLVNKNTGDYLAVKLVPIGGTPTSATLTYVYKIGTGSETDLDASMNYVVNANTAATVGIDFETLAQKYASTIGSTFVSPSNLKMYIGNDENFTSDFIGRVYTLGFMTQRNYNKTVSSYFNSSGLMTNTGTGRTATQTQTIVTALIYSYKLSMVNPLGISGKYELEIGANSYWEDYAPVKTLSKYTSDGSYELDFIQFNIDYPEPIDFSSNNYNTADSDVKTYVIFRYLSDGSYVDTSSFTTVSLPNHGTLIPDSGWATKKYEVVDGTIIYLPSNLTAGKTINDLTIVVSVELNNLTTRLSPIKIRSIELASQTFDDVSSQWSNGVGTRFGDKIYPYTYTLTGLTKTFDYKQKNPYRIYKKSTPYLYLTKDSGVRVSPYSNGVSDSKGISIPINTSQELDYNLSSLQMSIRYDNTAFSATETKIFTLECANQTIDFYMIATSYVGNRARIYAKVGSNEFTSLFYFLNSSDVAYPTIGIGEWANIGIAFDPLLDFDNFIGDLRLTGPLTFNNISYYQYTGLQDNTKYADQRWNYYEHSAWSSYDTEQTWAQVLATTYSAVSGINPIEIYNISIGTNKVILDNSNTEDTLLLSEKSKKIVGSVEWQSAVLKPV